MTTVSRRSHKSALLLGSALAAMALAPTTTAFAQEDEGDVIVVRGIKKSIQDSLQAKKDSTSIVEAVSAEDIGKLPDLSIADALARLPGLTAQRVRGRAQQLSIRGLGPNFSIALLNGREQVSAGDNRGIEFDQYASELIAQGLVYKTPDARLAATGVAGAVDLKTIRPLDYSDTQITTSARYVWNDNGSLNPDFDDNGYRLFGSWIGQNEDRTLGWVVAVTTQSNPSQNLQRELKTASGQVGTTGTGEFYAADNPRSGSQSREFKRDSISGTLQWEPVEQSSLTLDAFYSDFQDEGIFRGIEHPLAGWSGATLDSYTTNGSQFVESATYGNANAIFRTDIEGRSAELLSLGANWTYDWTERLKTTVDLSRSSVDRKDIDLESYAGFGQGGSGRDTITFVTPASGEYTINPGRAYDDPNTLLLTDPGGWGQDGFVKEPRIQDEINQIRLEAEYGLENEFFSSLVFGYLRTERDKERESDEAFLDIPASIDASGEIPLTNLSDAIIGTADLSHLGINMVAYSPQALINNGIYQRRENPVLQKAWTVNEEIDTLYAMGNIDTTLNDMPLRGNVGLQYQSVDQSSTSPRFTDPNTGAELRLGDTYEHWLPSLNLSLEVVPNSFIRFGAAETVTRPRMDQMNASIGFGFDPLVCQVNGSSISVPAVNAYDPATLTFCLSAGGGNPYLKPYESTAFDLAFEKYFFNDTAALSIAVYHKDISNWVEQFRVAVDATDVIDQIFGAGTVAAEPILADGTFDAPTNLEGGTLQGVEVALNLPFDEFLPDHLEGFGMQFSYSYTDSEIEVTNPNDSSDVRIQDVPGLSKDIWNGSVYYENHGWRARLSGRYRSEYTGEVPNFDGELNFTTGIEETVLDAQVGYEFQNGPLEGVAVQLEAYNITDEPFGSLRTPGGDGTSFQFPSRLEYYGTSYNLSISKTW